MTEDTLDVLTLALGVALVAILWAPLIVAMVR